MGRSLLLWDYMSSDSYLTAHTVYDSGIVHSCQRCFVLYSVRNLSATSAHTELHNYPCSMPKAFSNSSLSIRKGTISLLSNHAGFVNFHDSLGIH